jgi:hypothetical protein
MRKIVVIALLSVMSGLVGCGKANFAEKDTSVSGKSGPVCPGEIPDPNACLVAKCVGPLSSPKVQLTWKREGACYNLYDPNSNSIQKGDLYPNDPGGFWGWILQDPSLSITSMTDTAVASGDR